MCLVERDCSYFSLPNQSCEWQERTRKRSFLPVSFKQCFNVVWPLIPVGNILVYSMFMLLICDLQTLCFFLLPLLPSYHYSLNHFSLLVVCPPLYLPLMCPASKYIFLSPLFPPSLCWIGSLGEIHFLLQPKHIKYIILCHGGQL